MMYEYTCDDCSLTPVTVVKPAENSHVDEYCVMCSKPMRKIYTATYLNTGKTFKPGWNPGLGKVIHNETELKEHLSRVKGETGRELIEVGNDKLDSLKGPVSKSYDDDIVDRIKI